jgi:ArsR family transcriptional regulator, arsenate/arsenite/antimonite-responsive transcriptional repressor
LQGSCEKLSRTTVTAPDWHGIMKSIDVIEALGALGQESRLAIVRLLVRKGPGGLSAGAIAERLNIPAPTLSFHLAHLHRAGLVDSRREGRSIIYGVSYAGMNALLTYLTEDCCRGRLETDTGFAYGPHTAPAVLEPGEDSHEASARVRRR